jgi:hypothetical protein
MITHGTHPHSTEVRKARRVELDGTPPSGMSVALVAQFWGMSRDEAFQRLHGDEQAIDVEQLAG